MPLYPLPHETIEGLGKSLRGGEISCVEILNRCLDRIDEWEGRVNAWVLVDRSGAIEQAESLDRDFAAGNDRGPLHGMPFGVKDIIDVKGLPSRCGFFAPGERIAAKDADVVERLRAAGAVILGKTVTTQFAWIDPPPTRNPWDLERTPGGSSSGSAAAVALGMCLGALGTQTGGSIIRPASFCGVVGYKPSSSSVSDRGIFPLSPSLDHPGAFGRNSRDVGLIAYTLLDEAWKFSMELTESDGEETSAEEGPEPEINGRPTPGAWDEAGPLRLLRPKGFFDRRAEPETLAHFEETLALLKSEGVEILEIDDAPFDFEGLLGHHRILMAAEAAAVHEAEFAKHPEGYAPHIRALIEEGLRTSVTKYIATQRHWQRASANLVNVLGAWFDTVVTPATIGPAPDASTTGNPCFNSVWSYLGWPTLTIPSGLSSEGLPLGLQLAGQPFTGVPRLFRAGEWAEDVLSRAFRSKE